MVYNTILCTECARVFAEKRNTASVSYIFLGHHPTTPNVLMCTWFHYVIDKEKIERGGLFQDDLSVFDFLSLQYNILKFDNQVHVKHWNLVLLAPFRFQNDFSSVFKILDHKLMMCEIPVTMLKNLQIHAVSVYDTRMRYLPTLVTPEDTLYFSQHANDTGAPGDNVKTLPDDWRPFDPKGYSNEKYYLLQQDGHGLFQNDSTVQYIPSVGMTFDPLSKTNPFVFTPQSTRRRSEEAAYSGTTSRCLIS